jgi:hypothetical protein
MGFTIVEDKESGLFIAKPAEESGETSQEEHKQKKHKKSGLLDQWKKELSHKRRTKKKEKKQSKVPMAFSAPVVPTQFKRLSLPHESSDTVHSDTNFLSARARVPLAEARSASNLNLSQAGSDNNFARLESMEHKEK